MDQARITEAVALVSSVLPLGDVGPYQVQVAITAVHDEAPAMDATDWPHILALYDLLCRRCREPVARSDPGPDGRKRGRPLARRRYGDD